ncbi:MAG: uracil-DNA glycosylase [Hyphomicrobiales bacterium]|nr:uracil-DNA glycosylase [Hyphomicrobiales bacterium]
MPTLADPEITASLLRWHVDAGVDLALDDHPHDRFAESRVQSSQRAALERDIPREKGEHRRIPTTTEQPRRPAPAPAAQRAASIAPFEAAETARALAASARTLDELRAVLEKFEGCALRSTATRLVFADGNPGAPLMLVGEAPGADEDRQGKPFVGRAGRLLDKMLLAIGLDRSQVYIANIIPWRPPGNRTPTPQETAICLPFIQRQIELAAPRLLVTLGAPSTQTLLGVKDGIMRSRGRWTPCTIAGLTIPTMPILHPAYLLRQPSHKRLAWRDLLAVKKALEAS